jgi:ATP-dependent DNA ligase
MNKREFKLIKKKTLVWRIWQDGEYLFTEHGQEGGAIQTFSDRPGDKGKPDTKAYVNALANTKFHIEREIRKKLEHGYIEYVDGKPLEETVTSIAFDKMLPKHFCGYKPQTDISDASLRKIHAAGHARYTRKYDGMCHLAVHHTWGWEIYSRRMDLATERFPNHVQDLDTSNFDVGTILVGEMVCQDPDGNDNFKNTSRICRSDAPVARKLVEDKEVPEPTFLIFDMLFHNGQDLSNSTYDNRAKIWRELKTTLIGPVAYHHVTPDDWEKTAKEVGWEGFVVTDGNSIPGEKFYSFDGDAKRPKGHHKLKPVYEADVCIFAAEVGAGKRLNGIGALMIAQKYPNLYPGTDDPHPKAGKWFYCGKCGSGTTDADLEELEKLFKENEMPILTKEKDGLDLDLDIVPKLVCMIEYGERMSKTQKFRHAVFIRLRTDKAVEECFAERLAPDEDE